MGKRILAIDTATTACSVALFENGKSIAHSYEEIGRGHAEKLVPMIAQLPGKGRADQIMVNCGPGSFTGVRIGLSAAKALTMAWHAEISGYQCLHLVAAQALVKMKQAAPIFVAMVGGHGEYFVQNFASDGSATDELLSLSPEAALRHAQSDVFAGSAAKPLAKLTKKAIFYSILPDAAKTILLNNNYEFLIAAPVYGRAPDAQPAH
ncbi:tRNA (adenosine(37)-N6)-threonylcarbamoyltransferase complex dimerization subunit type 1 TsaB [Parasphingorhabdus cellanae]|uniref:tRNA (Adenosine(37)-N6)-threonylcarbamoyltransferase complex dimerization subunit type 1 TsaB n=1 Tax=Parasphingorhabdus cellanae TaxID=2806553 RepID=A0ABX7T952_9SPHN|nr:tRNA (adenosine(37)-N6)-threonylcarbamoyltransferase complex dimerization subunit type 1 TsaB [Parasphingorhabdus cellanae]QTD56563.1 tRNA (adenosine(37)-N6)-threonylcarbamoyltransferase complex dimerization subunit type 1 TsaB [Parasphingorhabdus cellanae]